MTGNIYSKLKEQNMRRKLIAFDLDGTLAPSKSPLPDRMAQALDKLLDHYHVCVMSGGKFGIFERQLLANLKVEPSKLERFHLMPTCGTRYYRYDIAKKTWKMIYAEDFTPTEKKKIITALTQTAKALGLEEKKTWGEVIEDRDSQITWSALGQDIVDHLGEEGLKLKEAWDPDDSKKNKLAKETSLLLPDFEVRVGGITSVDITKPGIDKAYGAKKLMEIMDYGPEDILFLGDHLQEGGNDYPVKAMGIDCLEVTSWQETASIVEAIALTSYDKNKK
jgi:HAD superfamily hydrolase (TIGR01484 family)